MGDMQSGLRPLLERMSSETTLLARGPRNSYISVTPKNGTVTIQLPRDVVGTERGVGAIELRALDNDMIEGVIQRVERSSHNFSDRTTGFVAVTARLTAKGISVPKSLVGAYFLLDEAVSNGSLITVRGHYHRRARTQEKMRREKTAQSPLPLTEPVSQVTAVTDAQAVEAIRTINRYIAESNGGATLLMSEDSRWYITVQKVLE